MKQSRQGGSLLRKLLFPEFLKVSRDRLHYIVITTQAGRLSILNKILQDIQCGYIPSKITNEYITLNVGNKSKVDAKFGT